MLFYCTTETTVVVGWFVVSCIRRADVKGRKKALGWQHVDLWVVALVRVSNRCLPWSCVYTLLHTYPGTPLPLSTKHRRTVISIPFDWCLWESTGLLFVLLACSFRHCRTPKVKSTFLPSRSLRSAQVVSAAQLVHRRSFF